MKENIIPVDRLFSAYKKGLIQSVYLNFQFVENMLQSPSDRAAIDLYKNAPAWFQMSFREFLLEIQSAGYEYLTWGLEESRTIEEAYDDSKRHAEILSRVGPTILNDVDSK